MNYQLNCNDGGWYDWYRPMPMLMPLKMPSAIVGSGSGEAHELVATMASLKDLAPMLKSVQQQLQTTVAYVKQQTQASQAVMA